MKRAIAAMAIALACQLAHAAGDTHWEYELLHSFNPGTEGYSPNAGLIELEGAFWGTTTFGGPGADAKGTVFKFVPGGKPQVMHTFRGRDGANPNAELLAVGRNLYGTLKFGMPGNHGGVFRMSTLGTFQVMNQFSVAEGTNSVSPLIRATDGNLYGTTVYGGAHGNGTAFRMTPSGTITVLHSFSESNYPVYKGPLVQHGNGFLYGTTADQGVNEGGSVFKISTSGSYTLLHSFAKVETLGCHPIAGLTPIPGGTQAGLAAYCGSGYAGTAFQVTPEGVVSLLHTFEQGVEGMSPMGEPVMHSDGLLYGTTTAWSPLRHAAAFLP